jgi:hypothetical protein
MMVLGDAAGDQVKILPVTRRQNGARWLIHLTRGSGIHTRIHNNRNQFCAWPGAFIPQMSAQQLRVDFVDKVGIRSRAKSMGDTKQVVRIDPDLFATAEPGNLSGVEATGS